MMPHSPRRDALRCRLNGRSTGSAFTTAAAGSIGQKADILATAARLAPHLGAAAAAAAVAAGWGRRVCGAGPDGKWPQGKGWWWWWWWWGLGVQFCGETVGTGQGSRSARVGRARGAHNPMGMGTCAPRAVPPFAPGLTPLTIPGRCWG